MFVLQKQAGNLSWNPISGIDAPLRETAAGKLDKIVDVKIFKNSSNNTQQATILDIGEAKRPEGRSITGSLMR